MNTDLIILGGGPAGLTAGIYACRARIPTVLLEKAIPGGQITASEMVDNYPGFSEPILGTDLAARMEEHAKRFGLEILFADVNKVSRTDDGFMLNTEDGTEYRCKAVILATGASPVKLGIPGELEMAGKGVSYCAVCDGPFYRETRVAVIGGGDSAVEEAVYLTRFADKVFLIHRRDELRAVKEIQEKAFAESKIEILWNTIPISIEGENGVERIRVKSVKDDSENIIPVHGVFFYVGMTPNAGAFADLVESDDRGFVITDQEMACSIPGIFAAGDLRSKTLRQISTAVGDGAIAAYCAQHYLESL